MSARPAAHRVKQHVARLASQIVTRVSQYSRASARISPLSNIYRPYSSLQSTSIKAQITSPVINKDVIARISGPTRSFQRYIQSTPRRGMAIARPGQSSGPSKVVPPTAAATEPETIPLLRRIDFFLIDIGRKIRSIFKFRLSYIGIPVLISLIAWPLRAWQRNIASKDIAKNHINLPRNRIEELADIAQLSSEDISFIIAGLLPYMTVNGMFSIDMVVDHLNRMVHHTRDERQGMEEYKKALWGYFFSLSTHEADINEYNTLIQQRNTSINTLLDTYPELSQFIISEKKPLLSAYNPITSLIIDDDKLSNIQQSINDIKNNLFKCDDNTIYDDYIRFNIELLSPEKYQQINIKKDLDNINQRINIINTDMTTLNHQIGISQQTNRDSQQYVDSLKVLQDEYTQLNEQIATLQSQYATLQSNLTSVDPTDPQHIKRIEMLAAIDAYHDLLNQIDSKKILTESHTNELLNRVEVMSEKRSKLLQISPELGKTTSLSDLDTLSSSYIIESKQQHNYFKPSSTFNPNAFVQLFRNVPDAILGDKHYVRYPELVAAITNLTKKIWGWNDPHHAFYMQPSIIRQYDIPIKQLYDHYALVTSLFKSSDSIPTKLNTYSQSLALAIQQGTIPSESLERWLNVPYQYQALLIQRFDIIAKNQVSDRLSAVRDDTATLPLLWSSVFLPTPPSSSPLRLDESGEYKFKRGQEYVTAADLNKDSNSSNSNDDDDDDDEDEFIDPAYKASLTKDFILTNPKDAITKPMHRARFNKLLLTMANTGHFDTTGLISFLSPQRRQQLEEYRKEQQENTSKSIISLPQRVYAWLVDKPRTFAPLSTSMIYPEDLADAYSYSSLQPNPNYDPTIDLTRFGVTEAEIHIATEQLIQGNEIKVNELSSIHQKISNTNSNNSNIPSISPDSSNDAHVPTTLRILPTDLQAFHDALYARFPYIFPPNMPYHRQIRCITAYIDKERRIKEYLSTKPIKRSSNSTTNTASSKKQQHNNNNDNTNINISININDYVLYEEFELFAYHLATQSNKKVPQLFENDIDSFKYRSVYQRYHNILQDLGYRHHPIHERLLKLVDVAPKRSKRKEKQISKRSKGSKDTTAAATTTSTTDNTNDNNLVISANDVVSATTTTTTNDDNTLSQKNASI